MIRTLPRYKIFDLSISEPEKQNHWQGTMWHTLIPDPSEPPAAYILLYAKENSNCYTLSQR